MRNMWDLPVPVRSLMGQLPLCLDLLKAQCVLDLYAILLIKPLILEESCKSTRALSLTPTRPIFSSKVRMFHIEVLVVVICIHKQSATTIQIQYKSGDRVPLIATRHAHINSGWWHTHTRNQVMSVQCLLCFYPILAFSLRESQEQWAASNAAPGNQVQVPGPVLVRDRTEGHLFFCMFLLWGSMGGTRVNTRRTCKLHTERSPNMLHHAVLEPTTYRAMCVLITWCDVMWMLLHHVMGPLQVCQRCAGPRIIHWKIQNNQLLQLPFILFNSVTLDSVNAGSSEIDDDINGQVKGEGCGKVGSLSSLGQLFCIAHDVWSSTLLY